MHKVHRIVADQGSDIKKAITDMGDEADEDPLISTAYSLMMQQAHEDQVISALSRMSATFN